jgi:hypothetical protein
MRQLEQDARGHLANGVVLLIPEPNVAFSDVQRVGYLHAAIVLWKQSRHKAAYRQQHFSA